MILFLYGEDTYRSRQKLKQIEERFKQTDKSRINLFIFDGEKTPFKNIEKEIVSAPFLHDKKLIVIENFLKKKGGAKAQEDLIIFLKKNKVPESAVIIFWEEGIPDMRSAVFKLLNKPKQAEKFEPLPEAKLCQWISKEVSERKIEIEKQATELLATLVGPDLWQIAGELDKLVAFTVKRESKQNIITAEDVKIFVKGRFDEDIFSLTDAIGNRNKKQIFKLLNEQISAGLKEAYIFSMLARQFRILFQIKETVEKKYSFVSPGDYSLKQNLASDLGLHPFVVQKTLAQIKNYKLEELKNIYKKLLSIDMKMKRTSLSPRLLLDLFLAEICVG
ncbi:DNA polymerase III subunit delta [Candidatus Falkowbacteria bacterium RIFOXYB2_FULL_38_15]|uniref:DNA polymerase III subunit delta n=1 Tax=Candidatus Falkowbacteria bacterium RIFOXYA2_FULL_38_12 TaxID=1797993 RepID=A0A1F5S3X5_9BACT|nr:MAG: DNA polymerase III subunit delta [Candidatus Falkowbacteria bacterium RIFOXYA2_FULL_38_12]OGF32207.1 MAG: DNA polymerase III subunit delta [Candidatus Falkowbacteria bacterium RIFOXYB2_FULL_38_15]OGF44584.1 MAG: DNA polymerase III subunit delta [Candidatus Falkowbacteria bacterium RIFOXYD2_FULL_39_16]